MKRAGFVAVAGLALGVVLAAARRLGDFDLGWHLALGRLVVQTHALPLHDDLSFTMRGHRVPEELLADTLLYVASQLGSGVGLQLVALVAIALVAWLLAARARPAAWPVAVAFAALALMAAGPWLVLRPALLSFVCLAAFLFVLDEHRRTRQGLWRLVPLQLLWSNLHGFAMFGPFFAVAYVVLEARARKTALVAVAVAAIACCSPLGWRLYLDPFTVAQHQGLITEWTRTSPAFLLRYDLPLVILGIALLASLLFGERPRAFDLLLVVVAVALSCKAVRMIALGAIVVAPLAARRLAPALERARGAALLVALFGVATAPVVLATPGFRYGAGYDEANLPEGAARFIAAARPRGALFNFMPFGGWLSFRLYPDVRVLIDGRTGRLYPVPFLERYLAAEHDAREFSRFVAEYDLQWAVVRARPGEIFGEPIARDARWTMLYVDDCAAVYVRADGVNRALAASGYHVLRHLMAPRGSPDDLRHDAELARQQAPSSVRARLLQAMIQ